MPLRFEKIIRVFFKGILWGLLFFGHICLGQGEALSLHFDKLTINDGLTHNTVYCLLQDHYGYIWIGTQNGLNKYDGYSFEVFRSNGNDENLEGFVGKSISALFEDKAGNLWVGTRKQGITFRKDLSDRFVNLQSDTAFAGIRGFEISSFFEDKAGNIWITTAGAGVLAYHPKTRTTQHFTVEKNKLSSNLAFDIVEDKYGTVWVATAGGGLNVLQKDQQFSLSHEMLPNHPNMGGYRKKLLLDDEYLWVGTEGTGLYRMNLQTREYTHFNLGNKDLALNSSAIRDLYKTKDGRLFIATDGAGLNVYYETTGEISFYTHQAREPSTLNSNALLCFWGDRTGNIWIGTYNGGINIIKANHTWFEFFTQPLRTEEELDYRSVLSVYQSIDGKIWVGTDGGGLNWLNPENSHFSIPFFKHDPSNPNSLGGNVIKTLFEDSKRRLWIGFFGAGLDIYDQKTGSFRHVQNQYNNPNSLGGNNVWSMAERGDGNIWIGTIGEGITVVDPKLEKFTIFQHNQNDTNSLGDANIMAVFIDRDDQVWVGTAENGLDIWEETSGNFVHYRHDPNDSLSISNNEVRAILQDSRGDIWIGTEGGGLNRWIENGRFERFSTKNGLIANSVMGIAEDQEGMIWVTTFEGISQINPATKAIRNFDFHSGNNYNQFNHLAILSSREGKLFFGGIQGLNAIRPDQVMDEAVQPNILFTDFRIFNKRIPVGELPDGRTILASPIENADKVMISYFDNSFSIEFTSIDFANTTESKFSYKMEGFDDNWQTTSAGKPTINYTNLDPGSYTFKVRKQEKEASLGVFITPPFWQTLWFRMLTALLFIGLIVSFLYYLIKRREATHRRQILAAERKILHLRNEKLKSEIGAKNSKLMFSAVQMAHKNEILSNVRQEVEALQESPQAKLRQLLRMLDKELKSEDYWEEFNLYFNEVDNNFGQALLKKHPELTQNDLRICALIRINLTTKEIASLLNITSRGVEQSRYRLKKRLGLGSDDSLSKYITGFDSNA